MRTFSAPSRRMVGGGHGFPPQLHAKCGIVDAGAANACGWVGSLNLTTNSAGYYEVVSVLRDAVALRDPLTTFNQ